ncbi:hypothetical protein PR048_015399 [Dryococelus australis]|uniref:Secreted protein n=1 Tax=Dryococelus australis TaxID=614101 RepID=A0ABQ9HH45_9NEOP|nr:hypothetical protein PR048_015399 [Dryococelus australis]
MTGGWEMLSRREALQLGALLLCVPVQYLLVVSVPSVWECTHAVLHAVSALRSLRSSLLRWLTPCEYAASIVMLDV